MALEGYLWLWRAIYGYRGLCLAVKSCVYGCGGLCVCVGLCIAVEGYVLV